MPTDHVEDIPRKGKCDKVRVEHVGFCKASKGPRTLFLRSWRAIERFDAEKVYFRKLALATV